MVNIWLINVANQWFIDGDNTPMLDIKSGVRVGGGQDDWSTGPWQVTQPTCGYLGSLEQNSPCCWPVVKTKGSHGNSPIPKG